MRFASVSIDGTWRSAVVEGDGELALLLPSIGTIDDIVRGGDDALRAGELRNRVTSTPLAEAA